MDWGSVFNMQLESLSRSVAEYIPKLVGALVVLVVGWTIAILLRKLVAKFLTLLKFDSLAAKTGLDDFFRRGNIHMTMSHLIAVLVYWTLVIVVLIGAVNILEIEMAKGLLSQVLDYMPNVISAVIILILGIYIGTFISGVIRTATSNIGIGHANTLAAVVRVAITIFTIIISLTQLRIQTELLIQLITLIVGAACLAAALAIGLGAKDIVRDRIEKYFRKSSES